MMQFYWLILCSLCVWRITHLFQAEDGPWDVSVRIRRLSGEGFWGDLLDCFYCLSLWISVPFALFIGVSLTEKFLLWPALSAASILLERATDKAETTLLPYIEDKEDKHELL